MGIVRVCCGLVGGPLPLTFPLQSMMRLKTRFKPALQVALRAILVTRTRIIQSHKIEAIIALISESRSWEEISHQHPEMSASLTRSCFWCISFLHLDLTWGAKSKVQYIETIKNS